MSVVILFFDANFKLALISVLLITKDVANNDKFFMFRKKAEEYWHYFAVYGQTNRDARVQTSFC
jgi:hypothetical protein